MTYRWRCRGAPPTSSPRIAHASTLFLSWTVALRALNSAELRSSARPPTRSAAVTRRLFERARANSSANPVRIRRRLPEQRAWDRSRGWPVRIDRGRGQDSRWRETIIIDHSIGFMGGKNGLQALFLVGWRSRLESGDREQACRGRIRRDHGRRRQLGAGDCQASAPDF